ncbi:phosphatase PAP2 family protein [Peristeroidobacter soli]|uniref:phosphatase PAP2 family protein n=1 Tax=Peristeroidobacter soli TaxID=2497877 RepID=UPI00101C2DC5|nr:phosphatase PAP2 family protein [Peristeroidobacter soli]
MTTEKFAEFLAFHLWAVVFVITLGMLVVAGLLWHALQRYGGRLVALAQGVIDRVRPHARRLPIPGAVQSLWQIASGLGIQVLVSLAVAVVACVGFVEIAEDIGVEDDLGRFDVALTEALSWHATEAQLRIFAAVTDLGDKDFLLPLGIVIASFMLFRRRWYLAAAWIVATAGGALANVGLKAIFERSRPEHLHGFASVSGWSFPSGHSSGSFIVYGLLAYLIVIHSKPRFHLPVAAIAMLLIVCVGFSRVVLQVHYFSDVLGGYAFGAAWVAAWIAGLEIFRRRSIQ